MQIDVITVFPKILEDPLNESILKQARKRIDSEALGQGSPFDRALARGEMSRHGPGRV